MEPQSGFKYRSLFWPMLLIGVGVVWLLGNLEVIPRENFAILFNLWPLILIVIGLDILFGRRSPLIGAAIGVGAIVLVIGLLILGPSLGMQVGGKFTTDTISEPISGAERAEYFLNLSAQPVEITALRTGNLFEGVIEHYGNLRYRVNGTSTRTITLDVDNQSWFFSTGLEPAKWQIGISPAVPASLKVDGGSGQADLILDGLKLTDLTVDVGSGPVTVSLPGSDNPLRAVIEGGSGPLTLKMTEGLPLKMDLDVASGPVDVRLVGGASIELRVEGGSGSLQVRLPAGAAVRVEVNDSGSGPVSLSSSLRVVTRGNGDEGVWETENYATAAVRILIILDDVGSGPISIQ